MGVPRASGPTWRPGALLVNIYLAIDIVVVGRLIDVVPAEARGPLRVMPPAMRRITGRTVAPQKRPVEARVLRQVFLHHALPRANAHTGTAEEHLAEEEPRPEHLVQAHRRIRVGRRLDLDDLVVEGVERWLLELDQAERAEPRVALLQGEGGNPPRDADAAHPLLMLCGALRGPAWQRRVQVVPLALLGE